MKKLRKVILAVLTAILWVLSIVLTPVAVVGATQAVAVNDGLQAVTFVFGVAICWAFTVYSTLAVTSDSLVKPWRAQYLNVMLEDGAISPVRAHDDDAGCDLFAIKGCTIPAGGSAVFDTGVHVDIKPGYVGLIKSRSGLNIRSGLTSEGVIDAGYTGTIVVKVYNHSDTDYVVRDGDKITQLVILPVSTPTLRRVSKFAKTSRGSSGFGSSGR